jgi:hypothetical protein
MGKYQTMLPHNLPLHNTGCQGLDKRWRNSDNREKLVINKKKAVIPGFTAALAPVIEEDYYNQSP